MSRINNNVKASQPVAVKKASATKSKSPGKSGTTSSRKTEKKVAAKPATKATTSNKKATQSTSSGMKKNDRVNNEKAAVKKTGVIGNLVGGALSSAELIQSLPVFLREPASRFLNENDINELYHNYKNANIPETSSTENYVTSVPSTNMIYTSQGTRSDYTPSGKPLESGNSNEKKWFST